MCPIAPSGEESFVQLSKSVGFDANTSLVMADSRSLDYLWQLLVIVGGQA